MRVLTICNHVHVRYVLVRPSVCRLTFVRPTHTVTSLVTNLRCYLGVRESVIDTYEHVCFP